jgi:quinol monooxygenase YgiN
MNLTHIYILKAAGSSRELKAQLLEAPGSSGSSNPESQSTGEAMVILRFKIRSKPDKSDELMSALAEIITPARATNGVINFDIARDLLDPDSFIATAVYDDGPALELQESLPEVDRVMAMLPESLVVPPERTIFDASLDPTLV